MKNLLNRTSKISKYKLTKFSQKRKETGRDVRNYIYNFGQKRFLQLNLTPAQSTVLPYFDGEEVWKTMWRSIESGQRFIWLSTFIIEDDDVSRQTIQKLIKAAKRGCTVVLVYDYFGSYGVGQELFSELENNGGIVMAYQNFFESILHFLFTFKRLTSFSRLHQKLLIVDGETGFCGGMNISRDYAAVSIGGTSRFKDSHCKITGPAVKSLETAFIRTLKNTSGNWKQIVKLSTQKKKRRDIGKVPSQGLWSLYDRFIFSKKNFSSSCRNRFSLIKQYWRQKYEKRKRNFNLTKTEIYRAGGNLNKSMKKKIRSYGLVILESCNNGQFQKQNINALKNAKRSIRITTPYFMPPPPVRKVLYEAAARGVQVQILTQGKSDIRLMSYATKYEYQKFVNIKGISIYEMNDNELHEKTTEIDCYYASIGSDNLDHISWGYNREVKIVVYNSSVAHKIRSNFLSNLENARQITHNYWDSLSSVTKALSFLAYHAYHLLYPWNSFSK